MFELAFLVAFGPPEVNVHLNPPLISVGEVAETCAWPTVVSVRSGGGICSGVLVHPRIVLYAAHCGTANKAPTFSEDGYADPPLRIEDIECEVNPDYGDPLEQHSDFAYCLLDEPVDLPVTPVATGCEIDELSGGDQVIIVGFGKNLDDDPFGTKRWATTTLNWIDAGLGELSLGGDGEPSVCAGDSGGPALIRRSDGVWRTLALASTLQNGECGAKSTFALARNAADFVLEETGIDITPCHDGSGVWNPGPECGEFFAAEAGVGSGDWARGGSWCLGTATATAEDTCEGEGESESTSGEGTDSGETGNETSGGDTSSDIDDSEGCVCRVHGSSAGTWFGIFLVFCFRRRQQPQRSSAKSTQTSSHQVSQQ